MDSYNDFVGNYYKLNKCEAVKITTVENMDEDGCWFRAIRIFATDKTNEYSIISDFCLKLSIEDLDDVESRQISELEFKAFLKVCFNMAEKFAENNMLLI